MKLQNPATNNPYLAEIEAVFPRILSLYNTDSLSPMRGVGDRFHWAWKLIDFPNGTFQGAAHGLARLKLHGLLPFETASSAIDQRIDDMISATGRIMRSNGSLEEAFPFERSFCVTALVVYDLLVAIELSMAEDSPRRTLSLQILEPLMGFLIRADEHHGMISNHLATAAAALLRWGNMTGDPAAIHRAEMFLERILKHQSAEGWFSEYGGADPGYQTLASYYLADVLTNIAPSDIAERLRDAMGRSVEFLSHFIHPDGSIGGIYASRNTRFFYPAGIEYLSKNLPAAAAISSVMRGAIADHRTVVLSAMDAQNLVPMFNSYCWAASLYESNLCPDGSVLPSKSTTPFRRHFRESGLIVDRGNRHYTVISTHKGGVIYHFKEGNAAAEIDSGAVGHDSAGHTYTSQTFDSTNEATITENEVVIQSNMRKLSHPAPGPWSFIALRLAFSTLLRWPPLANVIKQLLVRLLITRMPGKRGVNRRKITLGENISIVDILEDGSNLTLVPSQGLYSVIHMASQGYWQMQDVNAGLKTRHAPE